MEDVSREYDWHQCNVPGCDAPVVRRLLCGEHVQGYLSSAEAEEVQRRVHRRILGVQTPREIWKDRIPFTGNATPMSFRLRRNAKQFVVIAAGGNPLTGSGDAMLAYALAD